MINGSGRTELGSLLKCALLSERHWFFLFLRTSYDGGETLSTGSILNFDQTYHYNEEGRKQFLVKGVFKLKISSKDFLYIVSSKKY